MTVDARVARTSESSPTPMNRPVNQRRRIVAIDLPSLSADLARRRHHRLRRDSDPRNGRINEDVDGEGVVLVFEERHGRRIVKDCCFRARERGVACGMAMVEAMVLVQGPSERHRHAARRHGSSPVMNAAVSDDVIVAAASPGRDAAALERLAIGCLRFAPIAAVDGVVGEVADRRHRILLDIRGCERWLSRAGCESGLIDRIEASFRSAGFSPRTAMADGVVAARAWAGWRPTHHRPAEHPMRVGRHDDRILPPGMERMALDPLPIECLEFDAGIRDRLHQVNVRSVAELRRLPRTALPARYGPMIGRRLDQLVGRGGDAFHEAGVKVVQPSIPMSVRREFTGPVRSRESVELAVIELVDALHGRLRERGAGVRLLRLRVEPPDSAAWIDQIELARATRRPSHLWSVLEPIIERVPLDGGIDAIELDAVRHRRLRRGSASMWAGIRDRTARPDESGSESKDESEEESLAAFVDIVQARLGSNAVRRVDPVGGHVPEDRMRLVPIDRQQEISHALERRLDERLRTAAPPGGARPPIWLVRPDSIQVECISERPVRLRWHGADHEVIDAAGPERVGVPWWRRDRMGSDAVVGTMPTSDGESLTLTLAPLPHRSYWSVHLATGVAVWIFRASSSGRWFLQGIWA